MKHTYLAIIAMVLLIAISCKSKSKKSNDEILEGYSKTIDVETDNYIVDLPKGWKIKDTIFRELAFRYLWNPQTGTDVTISITNEPVQDDSFDDYKVQTIDGMRRHTTNFVELDEGDFMASDMKASWFRYTYGNANVKRENILYMIPNNGTSYLITASTKLGGMNAYRSTFDSVARSFRFGH